MTKSRRSKEASVALALLVLTGSAVASAPAFAESYQALDEVSAAVQADDILANVSEDASVPMDAKQKIEEARKLLKQSTDSKRVNARPPTCG